MALSRSALKILLMITNVILFICGGVVLGVGIWAVSDKVYLSDIVGNSLFAWASYLMVICGTMLLFVSFLGCAAAITGKKIFILVYPIILGVVLILLLTAAICAAVFQGEVEDGLMELMKNTIREQYGSNTEFDDDNADITSSWDRLQSSLSCCGVEDRGWNIYQESRWYQNQWNIQMKKYVPVSCCVYDRNMGNYRDEYRCQSFSYGPPTIVGPYGSPNDALFYEGCYNRVREYVVSISTIVLSLGFSFLVFLIAGIVISLMFYWHTKSYGTDNADLTIKDRFNDKRNLRDSERRGFHDRDHRDMDEPDYRDYRDKEPGHRMSGRRDHQRQDRMSEKSDDRSDYRDNDDEPSRRMSGRRDNKKQDRMNERSDDRSDYRDNDDEPFRRTSGRRDYKKQDRMSERSDNRSDYRDDDRDNYEDYDSEPRKVKLPDKDKDRVVSYKNSAI